MAEKWSATISDCRPKGVFGVRYRVVIQQEDTDGIPDPYKWTAYFWTLWEARRIASKELRRLNAQEIPVEVIYD